MTENILGKLFEHNNWANLRIIQACSALTDQQLDAEPRSATKGTIRFTLWHLVSSQQSYLSTLTGMEPHFNWQTPPAFAELRESVSFSGERLLDLARGETGERSELLNARLQTNDGYFVEPWVVMVQIINHATEHREQINSMLSSLGVTPPDLDGWTYGEVANALIPISK